MEEFGLARFDSIGSAVRKKRSQTSRRPKPDAQLAIESCDHSPSSTTPPSDDVSKASSDENVDTNSRRKEFNLNLCMSRVSSATEVEGEKSHMRNKESGGFNAFYRNDTGRSAFNNKRSSEGVLAPANWKNTSKVKESFDSESRMANIYSGRNGESQSSEHSGVILDALVNDNKVKKVKLKVGGVTHTIHANSPTDGASSAKNSRCSQTSRSQQKQNFQGNLVEEHSNLDKRTGLQGVPWKGLSAGGFCLGKDSTFMGKLKNTSGKQGERAEPVRKSKRVPKRRVLDGEIGEDYEDDEIRYLEKLRTPKIAGEYKDNEEFSKKQRKLSSMDKMGASKLVKDGKKKCTLDRASEDTDYEEEDDLASEGEHEGNTKKKQKKESIDTLMDGKREMTLTTRQRALQSSKDGSTPGANLIEFPNGLPPAAPRKQKEKLSEVEQQLKKAEAAQRRRMQVEKAARESEVSLISLSLMSSLCIFEICPSFKNFI
ncbi:hypothetical protein P3X46_003296 [Hevea brasiliensis]|uniref:INO80 complex subunit B-like conserved region domain-containing protein n=1 Tax=Hevea brasiliensis TaxID=3981 RepID=A0ABQ9N5T9_HEVBR|nr:hypothetical protein P3X46_003296 [Hevea brasiliensis]